ncbi:hypothetical protein cyc_05522 [Cyclospora cayetanensis]|uniref:Uncharacterized protein n=1 Tax=Cyclospora cayetanensis TaxID=88456 RepID=A0A1D3CSN9_9EIME|nr:hypothetical protein cyc_05522 [Cyclospora cayetanensis]
MAGRISSGGEGGIVSERALSSGVGLQQTTEEDLNRSSMTDDYFLVEKGGSSTSDELGGLSEYIERPLKAGEDGGEAVTTRTTRVGPRSPRVPLDSTQWLALVGAVVALLVAAGWHLSERFPQLVGAKPTELPIVPHLEPSDPLWHIADLKIETSKLKHLWQEASEEARQVLATKYLKIQPQDGQQPLQVILEPVENLIKASALPEGPAIWTQQIQLLKGVVNLASRRLKNVIAVQILAQKSGLPADLETSTYTPNADELKKQTNDGVSLMTFMGMLLDSNTEGVPTDTQNTVPEELALNVATSVKLVNLESTFMVSSHAGFAGFMKSLEASEEQATPTIPIPGQQTKEFPSALLAEFLRGMEQIITQHPLPIDSLESFMTNFDVESLVARFTRMREWTVQTRAAITQLKEETLEKYEEDTGIPGDTENLFTAILNLF